MDELLLDEKELERCRKLIENSISEIVKKSDARGGVFGLSGGIDSSVVLKLAVDAGVDVHALILPDVGITSGDDIKDAEMLANDLGVDYSIIEINPAVESISGNFPWDKFGEGEKQISLGNIKARTRMIFNYLVANIDRRIVLGTGNKTEALLGYTTKYGDNAADIMPIGDLYKTWVKQLAEHIGIPKKIVEKKPSAGLWEGQTDEEELRAGYGEIDRILYCVIDRHLSVKEALEWLDMDRELVERILGMVGRSEHKREMPGVTRLFG